MLYSLIPPILIVLSLAGIILFLMKKAPDIVRLKNIESEKNENFLDGGGSSPKKRISGGMLLILEKLTHRFKIFLLKLENIFTGLGEKIKRKRNGEVKVFDREKFNRPILSEKVAVPKNYVEKKDLFENILIDRIAANPKDLEAYERLGEYYLEVGSWGDAKECFKQVMKLDARNENAKAKLRKLEKTLG